MSRIDQLIARHCPHGVEHRELAEIGVVIRGKRFVKEDMRDAGTPCIHYGEIYTRYGTSADQAFSFVDTGHAKRLRRAQHGDVIIASAGERVDEIGKAVAWLGGEEVVIHDACYAFSSPMDPHYVAYFFQSELFRVQIRRYVSSSKISSVSTQDIGRVRIPVPPMVVQREIATILHKMELLNFELEAELAARKRQYDHYRSVLLASARHRRVEIGEFGRVAMCKRIFKHQTKSYGAVPFYKIGTFGKVANAFISRELFEEYRDSFPFPRRGDVLISAAGTIGRVVTYDGGDAYFQDSNIVWIEHDESVVTNAYLRHCFGAIEWAATSGGTIKRLYNSTILRTAIAVPSLDEQRQIVAVLDGIDSLVSDRSAGLPAEIAARRTQYEYYRDKLLTFEGAA